MKNLPNYLIVIPSLTLGGAEKQALNYARALLRSGIANPFVLGLGRDDQLINQLEDLNIPYASFDASAFFRTSRLQKILMLFRFGWFLRSLRPDTIIGFTYWPNVLCGVVWPWTGARIFYWNQRSVDSTMPINFWERLAIRFNPHYISNGIAGNAFITERHGIKAEQVEMIPNVVHLPDLKKGCDDDSEGNGTINLLMTANFFAEKDHETLLRALRLYLDSEEARPIQLYLVGSAPGSSPAIILAKALTFDLNLDCNVSYCGKVLDMHPLLFNAHIGILSTQSEGTSNAILEYMAYGLPVIATDILANREAMGEKNAQWLFPVGDAGRLAELLNTLITHPDRSLIGQHNRAYIESRHANSIFEARLKTVLNSSHP